MAYAPRNDRAGGGSRGGFGGGFNKGPSKCGGAPRGRGGFGGGFGDREKPELFPAVCADCGNRCEVPFKPNGRKPVLCRDCFATENGSEPRFGGNNDRPERAPRASAPAAMSEDLAAQIRSIQGKLDMIIKSLNANDLGL